MAFFYRYGFYVGFVCKKCVCETLYMSYECKCN